MRKRRKEVLPINPINDNIYKGNGKSDLEIALENTDVSCDLIRLKGVREEFLNRGLIEYSVDALKSNLLFYYESWVKQKGFLVFVNGEKMIYSLMAKRGNSKYVKKSMYRLNKVIKKFRKLPRNVFVYKTNSRDEYRYRGRFLLVTLTLDRTKFLNRRDAFERMTKIVDNFIRALEKHYHTKIFVLRGMYELHKDGYPHLHLLLIFQSYMFRIKELYSHKEKKNIFRIHDKDRSVFRKLFPWGNIDIRGISNQRKAGQYAAKYAVKNVENASEWAIFELAMNWIFRKHGFTFRRLAVLSDLIRSNKNSHQKYEFQKLDYGLWILDYTFDTILIGFIEILLLNVEKFDFFILDYHHPFAKKTREVLAI